MLGAFVVLCGVAIVFFREPLFGGVSFLMGDNATHSLPLSQRLGEGDVPFWNVELGFGAPVYADGTTGWFHPWKVFLFAVFPWLVAHDLVYVTSFVVTGVAALLLARTLEAPLAIALTAALAAAFSPAVLDNHYNAAYAMALAWSGIGLVAFEAWWKEPNRRRACVFAFSIALLTLAAYPPLTYAWCFYLGIVVVVRIGGERQRIASRLLGFSGCVVLGLGLAAFQVLPMLELAQQSVRQGEVAILHRFDWTYYVAGLFFSNDPALYRDSRSLPFSPAPLGSALSFIAVAFFPLLRDRRSLSHVAAIAVCVLAVQGPGGVVFDGLRAVMPGFDRLRILSPFLFVTIVPSAALFAVLLTRTTHTSLRRSEIAWCALSALFFALLMAGSLQMRLATSRLLVTEAAILGASIAGIAVLRSYGRTAAIPILLVVAIGAEIALLRSGHLTYLSDSILDEERELAAVLRIRQREDLLARGAHLRTVPYKQVFEGMVLQHWKTPGYERFVRAALRTQTPNVNLGDRLAFVGANDALPLAAVLPLRSEIQREIRGQSSAPYGTRVIDRWRVRWLVLYGDGSRIPRSKDLETIWRDPAGDIELLENRHVLPALRWEPSSDSTPPLASPAWWQRAIDALPWAGSESLGETSIAAPEAGRIVAAVPWFPGWSAILDGERVTPRRAQDGAMELPVSAGTHRIELHFVPYSFHLGVGLSIGCAAIAAWLWATASREEVDA